MSNVETFFGILLDAMAVTSILVLVVAVAFFVACLFIAVYSVWVYFTTPKPINPCGDTWHE